MRTLDAMNAPSAILRAVFIASAFASSMAFLGSVLPQVMQSSEYSQYVAAAMSCLIAFALCFRLIRSGLLASPSIDLCSLFRAFVKSLVWAYLKLAIVIGAVFVVILTVVGVSFKDAGALSTLFALWLALWLAPAMASLATGRELTAKAQNGA
jgi:hypothetical protein